MPAPSDSSQIQSIANLAGEAIARDPELQSNVRAMVQDIVANVSWTFAWGSAQDKAALMKAVVPAMIRSMSAVEDRQAAEAQQREYEELRAALGGEV